MKKVKLSDRVRPDVEAAPWVIDEIKRLELELDIANLEIRRIEGEYCQKKMKVVAND
jgi:hypothetical protein